MLLTNSERSCYPSYTMEKTIDQNASALGKKSAERFKNMTKEQKSAYFKAIRKGNKGDAKVIHTLATDGIDERS